MSLPELRAHILKLDTEIGLQRELLRKLERDKSIAQRQINAVLDPMARLPFEISSEIFLETLDLCPEPKALHAPMLLLNICHSWSDIALSKPALWAAINIPCARGLKEILPIWLERAQNRPLSVLLEGKFDQDVVSVIWGHGRQLKHLEIVLEGEEEKEEEEEEDTDERPNELMELWSGTTGPGPLPSLVTLTISDALERGSELSGISPSHVFKLLRLAPNLTECLFFDVDIIFDDDDAIDGLLLPNLRRLTFGEDGRCPSFDHNVIESLSLPGLESLSATVLSSDLFAFLKRSSPPLLELVLGHEHDFLPMVECLRLIPQLRRFEMWQPHCPVVESLFAALAESPSLLPQLSTLAIRFSQEESDAIFDSFWTVALRALVARRTRFQVLHLMVHKSLHDSKMPPPHIVAEFRELALNGVQIHLSALYETWTRTFS
jgi:hypothetical protein